MKRAAMIVWLATAVACLQPGHEVCSDGVVCPEGFTCAATGCLSPEQLAECAGRADGDPCTVSLGTGICETGACIVARCGNGSPEAGEACDDGNQFGGDGCNATCSSTEACGNGLLELEEECDCGDAEHPSTSVRCNALINGDSFCAVTCKVKRCGDGVEDPGEECDDGNTIAGDGCNFDCTSTEICGNQILDYFAQEQCDDGNTRPADGCAVCRIEQLEWQPIDSARLPDTRSFPAMAYDTARRRAVMFGGRNDLIGRHGDTWELDGSTWIERTFTGDVPRARWGAAMVYDPKRARVVMFGGFEDAAVLSETWEYDGFTWRLLTPALSPPGLGYHAMAYDAVRDRIVLFGGNNDNGATDETWELDGVTWIKRQPATVPPARESHGMAFDPVRGRVVMYAGHATTTLGMNDVWEWTGTNWLSVTTTGTPPFGRYEHTFVYDPGRAALIAFGGYDDNTAALADTWKLVGSTWSEITTVSSPIRQQHASIYDGNLGRLVVFGGIDDTGLSGNSSAQLTTDWAPIAPPVLAMRGGTALTYDAGRGKVVLFGGLVGPSAAFDTWELDGATWRQVVGNSPPGRFGHAMAYDSTRRRIVLFGGLFNNPPFSDTWELVGNNWSAGANSGSTPPGRNNHAMAFDASRGRIVMFGGYANGGYLGDTWEYDGSTWMLRSPAMSPPGLVGHAMTYDSRRRRVVLFGGQKAGGAGLETNDTWEWDGTTWSKRVTSQPPRERWLHGLAYDADRDVLVVHAGAVGAIADLSDTWELQGATWRQRLITAPPPAYESLIAYDSLLKRMVRYHREALGVPTTWTLEAVDLQIGETCTSVDDYENDGKAGCADDECWSVCTPQCPPGATSCPTTPPCGDGVCTAVESCRTCPADCAVGTATCPKLCGDNFCDSPETIANCPGDCTP